MAKGVAEKTLINVRTLNNIIKASNNKTSEIILLKTELKLLNEKIEMLRNSELQLISKYNNAINRANFYKKQLEIACND